MDLETLKIDLKGLNVGHNPMVFKLDEAYFKVVDAPEVSRGNVEVRLDILRAEHDMFTLDFDICGTVIVPCDLCLDDMEQPIEAHERLTAKFGEDYSEEDNLVTVAEDEGILDVTWYVYECIALAIPIKHVHAPGKCNPAMIRVLDEHSAARSGEGQQETVDPRWAALEQLKNKN